MKIKYLSLFFMVFLLFYGCKKPKPVVYSGQLLLTKKNPIPLINKKIEIFQSGGNAIIMGSSGSSASSVTDANGRFNISFLPGSSYFIGFTQENSSLLTLAGVEGSHNFIRRNFSHKNYDPSKPIYVGKSIDSMIVKVYFFKKITTADTFKLVGNTVNGSFEKVYSGVIADSATTIIFDTIYNVLLTDFDCYENVFRSYDIQFGRLKTYPGTSSPYFHGLSLSWLKFSPEDEQKKEMLFHFSE